MRACRGLRTHCTVLYCMYVHIYVCMLHTYTYILVSSAGRKVPKCSQSIWQNPRNKCVSDCYIHTIHKAVRSTCSQALQPAAAGLVEFADRPPSLRCLLDSEAFLSRRNTKTPILHREFGAFCFWGYLARDTIRSFGVALKRDCSLVGSMPFVCLKTPEVSRSVRLWMKAHY